jgi:hypothetical protein
VDARAAVDQVVAGAAIVGTERQGRRRVEEEANDVKAKKSQGKAKALNSNRGTNDDTGNCFTAGIARERDWTERTTLVRQSCHA